VTPHAPRPPYHTGQQLTHNEGSWLLRRHHNIALLRESLEVGNLVALPANDARRIGNRCTAHAVQEKRLAELSRQCSSARMTKDPVAMNGVIMRAVVDIDRCAADVP
jgi:hypothetical protein